MPVQLESIISKHDGFAIKRQVLHYNPSEEKIRHQASVVLYTMVELATNNEKPLDVYATEGIETPLAGFEWIRKGVVQWERSWPYEMRKSAIFGERPVFKIRKLEFDFNIDSTAIVKRKAPEKRHENGFFYCVNKYSLFFDFTTNVLYFW